MCMPPPACCGSNERRPLVVSALTADIVALLTPGYIPLAAGSPHSPGAKCCRYFVAGRSLCEAAGCLTPFSFAGFHARIVVIELSCANCHARVVVLVLSPSNCRPRIVVIEMFVAEMFMAGGFSTHDWLWAETATK